MITEADIVIALSNSGDTRELGDVVAYCTRFAIPLVAVTARVESMLGRAAKVCLRLPFAEEACRETSAPTTSTTMMMALGDAVAVALLERRGFDASAFRRYHPGGRLGAALMRVADVMHRQPDVPLVRVDVGMHAAVREMTAKGFGCVGVVDPAHRLVGMVTDGDLRRHLEEGMLPTRVNEVMTTSPRTTMESSPLSEVLRQMTGSRPKITAMLVVDADNRPIGIVHIHDCLDAGLV